jgi:signal transduction histidine kinase
MEFCGPDFRPEFLYIEDWDEDAERAVNEAKPFRLGLHPHWFTKIQRQWQAQEIIDKYQKEHPQDRESQLLGFLPDTAHLFIAGDDPIQAVANFSKRLAGIHLKDWKPSYGRFSHRYAHGFVSLGDGVVDVEGVLTQLDAIRFDGWAVVEQDAANTTPGQSALRCANWLARRSRIARPDDERLRTLLSRETTAIPSVTTRGTTERELSLLRNLLSASSGVHAEYYQAVVESFKNLGGLDAVKLYTYCARNDELYLLAGTGLAHIQFRKILTAHASLCGHVTRRRRVHEFDLSDPNNAQRFDHEALLNALPGKRMITVPIFNPSNANDVRYLLNLFPNGRDFWGTRRELENLVAYVALLADRVSDEICSSAAAQTSHESSESSSRDEFLQKLVTLIQKTFRVEGVSIFLVNEGGTALELGATTGIEWDPRLKPHERFYAKGVGLTGTTWAKGEVRLFVDTKRQSEMQKRSWEARQTQGRDEWLFAPLGRLGGKVIGVVRLVNKTPGPGSRAATMFTDDDAAVLDSIIQAAIPHLELLQIQERQLQALTRITHEFQVPLIAIRGAIDFMHHALIEKGHHPRDFFGQDYLSDVLDWSRLMGRLAHNARLFAALPGKLDVRQSRTLLKADVVAPAVKQVDPLLKERGFPPSSISFGDFADLPALHIDRNQFQQVFFNLLSNSIKYSDRSNFKVRVDGGEIGSTFVIWFEDWGQGIDEGMEEMIFHPGFREEKAIRRDATGQGIGLTVVRAIVEAHGGTVNLKSLRKPTTFEIVLPVELKWTPRSSAGKRSIRNRRHRYD